MDYDQVVRLLGKLSRPFETVFLFLDGLCQCRQELTLAMLIELAQSGLLNFGNLRHLCWLRAP